jgi:UDP-N-acetylglucosamine 2-epimerase (non-hydrolysing)
MSTQSYKNIAIICGARPNFMKVAPLCRELRKQRMKYFVVNTGQHFSKRMVQIFLKDFKIRPKYNLRPSKSWTVKQFADIMKGLEKVFYNEKPDLVIVVGDVNSTLAGALAANKMNIKVAHLEAGLRSFNNKMPEEYNRVLTDRISNLLFVTAKEGMVNLKREKITDNVFFVGNIMIDTMKMFLPKISEAKEDFYFCTLHRAENVDDFKIFSEILNALEIVAQDCGIYLPLHPRTKKMAKYFGISTKLNRIFKILPPLNYKDTLYYQKNAKLVFTDSGGIQEETSYLGTPCITMRTETERPVTVELGTNTVGDITKDSILRAYRSKDLKRKKTRIPLWDGKTAERTVRIIKNL